MTLTTFDISGDSYSSYASIEEADSYLRVETTLWGAWNILTDLEKQERLIQATRRIDMLPFMGSKTDPMQATEWPRTGVKYADGSDVPDDVIPAQIETATIWLAGNVRLPLSPVANLGYSQDEGVASVRVGPRTTSYWHRRRTDHEQQFPTRIRQLLAAFLAQTFAVGAPSLAFDEPETSVFEDQHLRSEGIA